MSLFCLCTVERTLRYLLEVIVYTQWGSIKLVLKDGGVKEGTLKQILKEMSRKLAEISFELGELRREIAEIKQISTTQKIDLSASVSPPNETFHFQTHGELETFNKKLMDKDYFTAIVQLFILVGGDDPKKHMLRIIKKVLFRKLATKFSVLGNKGKDNFSAFKKVLEAIEAAVRHRFTISEDVMHKYITSILASARDWDGGRKERQPKIDHIVNNLLAFEYTFFHEIICFICEQCIRCPIYMSQPELIIRHIVK